MQPYYWRPLEVPPASWRTDQQQPPLKYWPQTLKIGYLGILSAGKIRFREIDLCAGDDGAGFVDIISAGGLRPAVRVIVCWFWTSLTQFKCVGAV